MPALPALMLAFVPASLLLGAVFLARAVHDTPVHQMTGDLSAITGVHPFTGLLSQAGLLTWAAAAAVSLLAALVIRRSGQRGAGFYLASAGLSLWLLADDAFLIHEELAGHYLGLGEKVVVAALGVATLVWLKVCWRRIMETGPFFLVASLAFFGLSVAMDLVHDNWTGAERLGDWMYLAEDGPKWLGIVCWLSFHVQAALDRLAPQPVRA